MKALLVDQYAEIGGGQTVFLQVLSSLVGAGIQVETAFPLGGTLERTVRSRFPGLPLHAIAPVELASGRKGFADVGRLAQYSASFLSKKTEFQNFDLVYVNGARLFPAFLALSTVNPARYIYHVHLDHSRPEKWLIGALLAHPRTQAVVVNSGFVLRRMRQALGPLGHSSKLRLIENTLSEGFSKLPFTDRFGGSLKVVVPGRVVPEKGQDVAVALAREFPKLEFHILGDADFGSQTYLDDLKRGAPPNVRFHGFVPDLAQSITQIGAQIALIPSRWEEPFGLTAIESMACSCLTLVSARGGLNEIAARTGALACESLNDWKKTLKQISESSPDALAYQARSQHEKTLRHYSAERFERDILELCQRSTQATAHMS